MCRITSAVGIVYSEHVDGDDLQHVCEAQLGRAMLEQRLELLKNSARHSRERFHAVYARHRFKKITERKKTDKCETIIHRLIQCELKSWNT